MDNEEARALLTAQLSSYRRESYDSLRRLLAAAETCEVIGASGAAYQVEVEAFWDSEPNGNLRVMGSIDDGRWRAFVPMTMDFLITPASELTPE